MSEGGGSSRAMKVNPFAVPVVRLQEERHQCVIDTGIYGVVRHPMYAGLCRSSLARRSGWNHMLRPCLAIVPIAVLAVRSVFEEQFLKRELEAYDAYTEKVRYTTDPICLVETHPG
jgi:protein-S-isoprenylcysteine O-methyltransferase Ste14